LDIFGGIMRPVYELIRRRQEVKAKLDRLSAEMDAIDKELLPRMSQLAAAFERPNYWGAQKSTFSWDEVHTPQGYGFQSALGSPVATKTAVSFTMPDYLSSISGYGVVMPSAIATNFATATAIVEMVKAILSECGRPMKTSEIFHELLRRNVLVGGKNPRNTLSAHLSNAKGVFASTSEGWVIRNPDLLSEDRAAKSA
jgi:hypothetical protein